MKTTINIAKRASGAQKDQIGDGTLFYTGEVTPKDLTIRFRGDMPAYMVPRRLVKLEEWPRLPNGKTDMRTLNAKMTGNGK